MAASILARLSTTLIRRGHLMMASRALSSCLSNKKVFVTRNVPTSGVELLKSHGIAVSQWESDDPIPREELLKQCANIDGLFCLLTENVDSQLLKSCGDQLKVIGTMSVGYDHVDLKSCADRNVRVGYTPEVLTHATAELTVSLLLSVSRNVVRGATAAKDGSWGTWKPNWLCGSTLHGSTVGIFGFGRIGQKVAKQLSGFEVGEFLYCAKETVSDTTASKVSFDELLNRSDYIICCCTLTPETKGVFNKSSLARMKRNAILVNTSRGPVVDMDDLAEALDSGVIAGAGLDVTVPEPLPTDHKLFTLSNCVVLPHIASATVTTRSAMSELTGRNIIAALSGEPMPAEVQSN